jgi:hypothetical protein
MRARPARTPSRGRRLLLETAQLTRAEQKGPQGVTRHFLRSESTPHFCPKYLILKLGPRPELNLRSRSASQAQQRSEGSQAKTGGDKEG